MKQIRKIIDCMLYFFFFVRNSGYWINYTRHYHNFQINPIQVQSFVFTISHVYYAISWIQHLRSKNYSISTNEMSISFEIWKSGIQCEGDFTEFLGFIFERFCKNRINFRNHKFFSYKRMICHFTQNRFSNSMIPYLEFLIPLNR